MMVVGDAPGYQDVQAGVAFGGKAGQHLWSEMRRLAGVDQDECRVLNLIPHSLPRDRAPKPAELTAVLPAFLDELERHRPSVVVTAGGFATKAVLGDWATLANVHGIPHTVELAGHTFTCLPIYHPKSALAQKGLLAPLAWDLEQLRALRAGDLLPWAATPYPPASVWHSEPEEWVAGAYPARGLPLMGVDTEGWPDKPHSLSYSLDGMTGLVIRADDTRALAWFKAFILTTTPILHNGLHDIPVLRAMGVSLPPVWHDTQVLAYHDILRTGHGALEAESQNLGTLAYRELGMTLRELEDCKGVNFKTRTIPYSDEVMEYAGEDACAAYRLYEVYKSRGLPATQAYQIDMGQIELIEAMQTHGLPINRDATFDYYAELCDKEESLLAELRAMAAKRGRPDFNPRSPVQVRDVVTRGYGIRVRKRTKGGQTSTNEKALAQFQHHPFVQKLQLHREVVKLRGTYVLPLLEETQ